METQAHDTGGSDISDGSDSIDEWEFFVDGAERDRLKAAKRERRAEARMGEGELREHLQREWGEARAAAAATKAAGDKAAQKEAGRRVGEIRARMTELGFEPAPLPPEAPSHPAPGGRRQTDAPRDGGDDASLSSSDSPPADGLFDGPMTQGGDKVREWRPEHPDGVLLGDRAPTASGGAFGMGGGAGKGKGGGPCEGKGGKGGGARVKGLSPRVALQDALKEVGGGVPRMERMGGTGAWEYACVVDMKSMVSMGHNVIADVQGMASGGVRRFLDRVGLCGSLVDEPLPQPSPRSLFAEPIVATWCFCMRGSGRVLCVEICCNDRDGVVIPVERQRGQ